MEVDTSLDHVSPAHQADAAAHGIPGNSQFESSVRVPHLGAVLAQQDLRLEEVLPSEPGGWVRILSALETQDRSLPFGALAEILDPFILESTSMMHCAPRAVRIDVDADAERVVHGLSFAVEGGGMTQTQLAALLGAPAEEQGPSSNSVVPFPGGNSITPAILRTAQTCLAVTRAAESRSNGSAIMGLVVKEPLVEGGGGGGTGGGRGNYVVPLAMVDADGRPIAGSVHIGPWLLHRRVRVHGQSSTGVAGRAESKGCDDACSEEDGWIQGSVSSVHVQTGMASFSFREDGEAGEGNQVHVDETKSWRLEKRGGGGWWSPNEEVWCEMRKRVSDRGWRRAVDWLKGGSVGTLLILEDMTYPGQLVTVNTGGQRGGGGAAAGEGVIDVEIVGGMAGPGSENDGRLSDGKGILSEGRRSARHGGGWIGPESAALPVTSSLLAYLEILYKGRQAELLLCGKRVKRKTLVPLMSQPRSYEFSLGKAGGGARVALILGMARPAASDAMHTKNGREDGAGIEGLRGFFLYTFRRLVTPNLVLQVQRSKRWKVAASMGSAQEIDVIGVLELELPATMSRQQVMLSPEEWQRLGAETEGCYLAYLAKHSSSKQRAPARPLGFVCWDSLERSDKELAEMEALAQLQDEQEEEGGEDVDDEAEGGTMSDSGEGTGSNTGRRADGRHEGRSRGKRRGGRGKYTISRDGGYVGEIIDRPRRRKAPVREGSDEDNQEGREIGEAEGEVSSPKKAGGVVGMGGKGAVFDGRKRWRDFKEEKHEREAKKILISSLTKGQKVWVFNSQEAWPLNSARKLKEMCLAGPDSHKVAIGRMPPQVGLLLSDSIKGWWEVLIQSTGDRIKCRLTNMHIYESGSAPPLVLGGMTATAAKEAAELEQRRNDVRNFLEEEGGGLCACGGRGQASSGGANKRHVLLDQQLLALVDLLAGTKATEHLMSWEKDEARWVPRSEEEGDGETGMRGGRRSSGKDKEDGMQMDEKQASEHASEQADDGLPKPGAGNEGQMGADTQGNGSDGSSCQNGHEVQKRDGQSAQDNAGGNGVSAREDGGFEEEEARSPRDAACVVNGRQRGGGGASACGRGEYASTAQAREALEAARTRREKAERELLLAFEEENRIRSRLTGSARLLGGALKGWRKDLEKISIAQAESKKLSSSLWTLCSHRRQLQLQTFEGQSNRDEPGAAEQQDKPQASTNAPPLQSSGSSV